MEDLDQIEEMILEGSIEVAGIDEKTGEFLYRFSDKMKTLHPELFHAAQNYFSIEMMALWEGNFISMDVTEANPIVRITQKALDPEEVSKLDESVQHTLKEVIRALTIENE